MILFTGAIFNGWIEVVLQEGSFLMKEKLAKFVRVITVPPVLALVLLLVLHFAGGYFKNLSLLWGIFFLVLFPLLSYPIWRLLPFLYKRGRSSQRALATAFSVLGYIGGIVYSLAAGLGHAEIIVFLTYLLSGILIAVTSYVFKIRSSGHACGVAGPIAMIVFRIGSWGWLGLFLMPLVIWSSLSLKRHTVSELLSGSLIPVFSMLLWVLLLGA